MEVEERIIAMIALKESTGIDPAAVAQRVKAMFPWIANQVGQPPPQAEDNETFILPMGEAGVAVLPIHFPIPKETLARAIGMNWFWAGAAQAFETSRAHIIVSALAPTNDPRYMRTNAKRVTCVTAALLELVPAAGIYWSTGENVVPPEMFIAETKDNIENGTPYEIWVTTEFFPGQKFKENEEIIARTCGMHVFIGREVECGPYVKEPTELEPIVRMVGRYVLDRNVQFSGGETVGTSEQPMGMIQLARTSVGVDDAAIYRIILQNHAAATETQ